MEHVCSPSVGQFLLVLGFSPTVQLYSIQFYVYRAK